MIEINGELYAERKIKPPRINPDIALLADAAMLLGMKRRRQLPLVDIIEEYKIIQAKKCNLSSSDREEVLRKFNNRFKKIKA